MDVGPLRSGRAPFHVLELCYVSTTAKSLGYPSCKQQQQQHWLKCFVVIFCLTLSRWGRSAHAGGVGVSFFFQSQMPIASSRVVVPEVPGLGSKDDWVDVAVNGVPVR